MLIFYSFDKTRLTRSIDKFLNVANIITSACQNGIKSADCLTRSNIFCNSGLIIVSSCNDIICPNLRAAPLTLHKVFTILSIFSSVKNTDFDVFIIDELFSIFLFKPIALFVNSEIAPAPKPFLIIN